MKRLRSLIFWLHLTAGILAGVVIAIMSFTGAALAFENEIVSWAERDVRRVEAPQSDTLRLSLDQLVSRVRDEAEVADKPDGITVSSDPKDAVAISFGRDVGTYYVNPYTGDWKQASSTCTSDFMHLMEDWHRRLAMTGDNRDTGRAITGASNLLFLFLGVSGLYLWWPRQWIARHLRPALKFIGAKGKARDWNWHNVIGFWSLPILIVLTATGVVMSYPWANNLVFRAFGETAPQRGNPGAGPATGRNENARKTQPAADLPKLGFQDILASVKEEFPKWETITLREGLARRRGPASEGNRGTSHRGPQPYSASIRGTGSGPTFASVNLVIDPFTGKTQSTEHISDQTPGRQARTWVRFLHTGAAFGWVGQALAGLACLGGCVLVYTGFALSWRRFSRRRKSA